MKKEVFHTRRAISYNLRDIILGGQDGLVNVLGNLLGVAAATNDVKIVILVGLVATFAESISMAAVAYTSSKAGKNYYDSILAREERGIKTVPRLERKHLRLIFYKKGFRGRLLEQIVTKISSNRKIWLDTLISEELKLSPEEYEDPLKNAFVVGFSSVVGSLLPLVPFFIFNSIGVAVVASLIFSVIILFIIGAVKARLSIGDWKKSGIEMAVIGTLAALAGYGIGALLGISR